MPGFDVTGPLGKGPLTGGGRGRCRGGRNTAPATEEKTADKETETTPDTLDALGVGRGGRPRGGGRGRCFGGGRRGGGNRGR
ncbi:MAG: hypothetical protein C4523_18355 [Myxococcales bacterium]|nr:MAG: hypothetical protein C4523_18355 [Myxococcales bacterium]